MSLVTIIISLVVLGVILWGVEQLPIQPTIKKVIYVVSVIFVVIWLAQSIGVISPITIR